MILFRISPAQALTCFIRLTSCHSRLVQSFVVALTLAWSAGAALAAEGIEVSRSVVIGGPRVVGLGGAFTSIGEGLGGLMYNSASLGNRASWRKRRWAADGTFGLSFQPLKDSDYENDGYTNGQVERQRSMLVGLRGQLDGGGIGWLRTSRHYSVPVRYQQAGRHEAEFTFVEQLLGFGFNFPKRNLCLGFTAITERTYIAATNLDGFLGGFPTGIFNKTVATALLTGNGPLNMTALELGSLYKPQGAPYRLGASLRITTNQSHKGSKHKEVFNDLEIPPPTVVRSPSLLRLGASYRFGGSYNPPPIWKKRELSPEEERLLDPELRPGYVLLSADLVVVPPHLGSTIHFKGPEGFALKRKEVAGRKWNVGLHGGAEMLLIPGWVRTRGGVYFEPSRFNETPGRLHVTGGFDIAAPHSWILNRLDIEERLKKWFMVPLMGRFYFDFATHYFSVGLSIGLWS